ncbi:MAG: hypothetical protein FWF07_01555 [Methanomassiliicoccaceae archaeon]|nr:hypothetical protein [Methanomassiliicoccaceae archaeon]
MVIIKGFTDYKSKEANQMGLISFALMIGYLFVFMSVVVFIAFIENKLFELYILAFIGMMFVVFVGIIPMRTAARIQKDIEGRDFETARKRSRNGKIWGVVLFSLSIIILYMIVSFFVLG